MNEPPTVGAGLRGSPFRGDPRSSTASQGTHVGRVRSVNQDACRDFAHGTQPMRLVVTADGMGGHRAGELASRLVVETTGEVFQRAQGPSGELARAVLAAANARILEVSGERPEVAGMGSTGAALLLADGSRAWVANVGDSRIYRLRAGRLELLTRDHSVVADLVRAGAIRPEDARAHPRRHELTRALGVRESVEIDLIEIQVEPGDLYLICTDGLWSALSDEEIGEVLARESPESATRLLIDRANEEGGADNITVQVIAIPDGAAAKRPAAARRPAGTAGARSRLLALALLAAGLAALVAWLLLGCAPGSR